MQRLRGKWTVRDWRIGDPLFFPRESPLVNCAGYKAYVRCVQVTQNHWTNGDRWRYLCKIIWRRYRYIWTGKNWDGLSIFTKRLIDEFILVSEDGKRRFLYIWKRLRIYLLFKVWKKQREETIWSTDYSYAKWFVYTSGMWSKADQHFYKVQLCTKLIAEMELT